MSRQKRRQANASLKKLARELPIADLAPLAVGIFALFALIGPIIDVVRGGHVTPAIVVMTSLVCGLVGAGYAFGMMRRSWWLFLSAIALQVLWFTVHPVNRMGLPGQGASVQLKADAIAGIVLLLVAYGAFLGFINGTAARYLRVRAEVELAHEIHQVLVPAINTRVGGFEFLGFSAASGEVGGDLVDVVPIEGGWFGYVADVSGHGVSSGVVMGMFKSALRMRLRQAGSLGELLTDVNAVLFPLKSSAMFVTVAGVRAGEDGALEYTVAGHLPILRVRDGRVDEITTPQIPIGMFEHRTFVSATLECAAGDLLVLITDGLIEVFDASDRELGLDAVKTLLASSGGRPLSEIADAIVAQARAHGKQIDDQTLLLIRR